MREKFIIYRKRIEYFYVALKGVVLFSESDFQEEDKKM